MKTTVAAVAVAVAVDKIELYQETGFFFYFCSTLELNIIDMVKSEMVSVRIHSSLDTRVDLLK